MKAVFSKDSKTVTLTMSSLEWLELPGPQELSYLSRSEDKALQDLLAELAWPEGL